MKQTIKIEVPEGKKAVWENDSIKFVTVNIIERIKTFEDALKELGDSNRLVQEYQLVQEYHLLCLTRGPLCAFSKDLEAYLKLRIIVAALNEGWEPKFVEGEFRYYPWYRLIYNNKGSVCSVLTTDSPYGSSATLADSGTRLAFKNQKLALYAAKQFKDLWLDFLINK